MIPDQDPQVTQREIKLSAEIARLKQQVEELKTTLRGEHEGCDYVEERQKHKIASAGRLLQQIYLHVSGELDAHRNDVEARECLEGIAEDARNWLRMETKCPSP